MAKLIVANAPRFIVVHSLECVRNGFQSVQLFSRGLVKKRDEFWEAHFAILVCVQVLQLLILQGEVPLELVKRQRP
jgi:hypothetical protein